MYINLLRGSHTCMHCHYVHHRIACMLATPLVRIPVWCACVWQCGCSCRVPATHGNFHRGLAAQTQQARQPMADSAYQLNTSQPVSPFQATAVWRASRQLTNTAAQNRSVSRKEQAHSQVHTRPVHRQVVRACGWPCILQKQIHIPCWPTYTSYPAIQLLNCPTTQHPACPPVCQRLAHAPDRLLCRVTQLPSSMFMPQPWALH